MPRPRPIRRALALVLPLAQLLGGCGAPGGFSSAKDLVDRYEVETARMFGTEDASNPAGTLEPARFFVPEFGPREETFELVATLYERQARLLSIMQAHLPAEVVEGFLSGMASERAAFVPDVDPDTLRATSPLTASANAKRPDGGDLDLTLVKGPAGWKILWDFDLARADRGGGHRFMQGIIRSSSELYDRVAASIADGTVTDLVGLWKAFGVNPPS